MRRFKRYAEAMSEIEGIGATSKTQADEILAQVEPVRASTSSLPSCRQGLTWFHPSHVMFFQDVAVRQFLMTNARLESSKITFRLPLATLAHAIDTLGEFPFAQGESRWEGPTLFIRGIRADYIADRHLPNLKAFFPNSVRHTSLSLNRIRCRGTNPHVLSALILADARRIRHRPLGTSRKVRSTALLVHSWQEHVLNRPHLRRLLGRMNSSV